MLSKKAECLNYFLLNHFDVRRSVRRLRADVSFHKARSLSLTSKPSAPNSEQHTPSKSGNNRASSIAIAVVSLQDPLRAESTGEELDWRVTRMRLSKDKASLIYNQFLPLGGIPPETYEYRLGNRSALERVIDQYQISG